MTLTAHDFAKKLFDRLILGESNQYVFRGAMALLESLLIPNETHEIITSGPAGTGKTLGNLTLLHKILMMNPGTRLLIVRRVKADIAKTVLATYEDAVLGEGHPISSGKDRFNRELYKYPNGSYIVLGGMDRPSRFLSSEWDIIYVPETIEVTEAHWEVLKSRLRHGNLPYHLIIGDTNPSKPDHWIIQRGKSGFLKLMPTTHRDNPRYFDIERDEWTNDGKQYVLGNLATLTGIRRDRFYLGKWVLAEGVIYNEFSPDVHIVDRFDVPSDWRRIICVDFGYTNPFSAQWWAQDGDGKLYLYREIYMTQQLVEDLARQMMELSKDEMIEAVICDHDAEGRATLEKYGWYTIAADKAVLDGIQDVKSRLREGTLCFMRDSLVEYDQTLIDRKLPTSLTDELGGYVWANKANKEAPVKANDHAVDAMRYLVRYVNSTAGGYYIAIG